MRNAEHAEPLPWHELLNLAKRYRLNVDFKSAAGVIGQKDGRETGSSVEIQDFRDYVPGDDPRRIDWMAYGRTDRLVVRLFREEVNPFFDLIVDASASMTVPDGRKPALVRELIDWLFHSAKFEGLPIRLFSAGERVRKIDSPEELSFDQPESALFTEPARAVAELRRAAVRMIVTDLMVPVDPSILIRQIASGCRVLIILQVLGPWESAPKAEGPAVLDSVEDGSQADVHLDAATVAAYRKRLGGLIGSVRDEMFRCGGLFISAVADRPLETVLRDQFLPTGLVEVA